MRQNRGQGFFPIREGSHRPPDTRLLLLSSNLRRVSNCPIETLNLEDHLRRARLQYDTLTAALGVLIATV